MFSLCIDVNAVFYVEAMIYITTGTDMIDLPASVSQLRLWLKVVTFDGVICLKWLAASFELPLTLGLFSHRGLAARWNKARASPPLPNKEGCRYKDVEGDVGVIDSLSYILRDLLDLQPPCFKWKLASFCMNVSVFSLGTNRFEVTLEKSNKNFSKKIQQVDTTPQRDFSEVFRTAKLDLSQILELLSVNVSLLFKLGS